ncbi:MAG: hypothetical protein WCI75_08970 [candidate division NC10 bacterium]
MEPARLEVVVVVFGEACLLLRREEELPGLADHEVILTDYHGHRLGDLAHGQGIEPRRALSCPCS